VVTPGKFGNKNQNNSMVASPKAVHCNYTCKIKPYKYNILNAKVTVVTPGHHPSVSKIAVNTSFLDFEKTQKKIKRA